MPTFVITHRGVPIGRLELDPGRLAAGRAAGPPSGPVAGPVTPLTGYEAVRAIVRAGSDALRQLGFLGPAEVPPSAAGGAPALAANRALGRELELLDPLGALVPADYIELVEWPEPEPVVGAWVAFGHAAATVPAAERRRGGSGADAAPPAA